MSLPTLKFLFIVAKDRLNSDGENFFFRPDSITEINPGGVVPFQFPSLNNNETPIRLTKNVRFS